MDNNIGNARRNFAKRNGKFTQEDAAKEFGVSLSAYRNWEQGKFLPSVGVANAIAKKYEVSVDYLLGVTDIPQQIEYAAIKLSQKEEELLEIYRSLTDEGKSHLLVYARGCAASYK